MDFPHGATITVIRDIPGGHDPYGDDNDGTQTTHTIERCAVAPRLSTDIDERGRDGVTVALNVYAPYGSDILQTDHIEVDGVRYRIIGDVAPWKSPFSGWEPGVHVALERAEG